VQTVGDVAKIKVVDPNKLAYVTQTTLSVNDTKEIILALKERFPNIEGPQLRDICYATQNRQDAVRQLASKVDLVLVIESVNSSNSNRLKDLALEMGIESYLIDGASDIQDEWLKYGRIGITAGASAPEILLEEVINYFKERTSVKVHTMEGVNENVKFKLPTELEDIG